MKRIGIIGGSGYTGGELIRILLNHPAVDIDFVYSTTKAGKPISDAHPDVLGLTKLVFSNEINPDVDVLFLCLGHGNSTQFLRKHQFNPTAVIIDLSTDFRLKKDAQFDEKEFVYGLPEVNKATIEKAQYIANPGCFATAIELALLPLAAAGLLTNEVHINAVTGSTGAGVQPSETTHFSWRNGNVSWYKPFTHQHLGEINERLTAVGGQTGPLFFLPSRGNYTRGIFATAYTKYKGSLADAYALYDKYYKHAVFTQVSTNEIHLKQVVNTNQCHLHLHQHEGLLMVTSVIDNLVKGASGQAVQNMNLVFGFEEDLGLNLKASYF